MSEVTPQQLKEALQTYFNLEELKLLAFDVNIPYENLTGGLSARALDMVLYAQRHRLYDKLVAEVVEKRPTVNWDIPLALSDRGNVTGLTDKPAADPSTVAQQGPNITHIYQAPVYNQPHNVVNEGGVMSKDIKVGGNVIGNLGDGDFNNEGQIAMGDIILGGQPIPQTREEFTKQLEALQKLLDEAVANGEFSQSRAGEKAAAAIAEVKAETNEPEPDKVTITKRLEEVQERIGLTAKIVEASSQVGKAVLKAVPVVTALIKLAQVVF